MANEELICVSFADRGFVRSVDFVKENSYVYFENLCYMQTTKIN